MTLQFKSLIGIIHHLFWTALDATTILEMELVLPFDFDLIASQF